MSVLTPFIPQTVNDCINVSDRKIATQNKQNVTRLSTSNSSTHIARSMTTSINTKSQLSV